MGREIRRVPANFEHPRFTEDDAQYPQHIGQFKPLRDNYQKALLDFEGDIKAKGLSEAIEYWGGGPRRDDYIDYHGQALDWFQLYETVSEGTPLSPPFATPEELVNYLVSNGDFWHPKEKWSRESAEAMLEEGWCPSMVCVGGKLYQNAEGLLH